MISLLSDRNNFIKNLRDSLEAAVWHLV